MGGARFNPSLRHDHLLIDATTMGAQELKSMGCDSRCNEGPSFLWPPTFSVWLNNLNPFISASVPHYRIEGKILLKREEFDRWL